MTDVGIAIIGAGLAGLACADALRRAGVAPVLIDKSRGVGGRLATRRAEGGLQFDHGAQYVTARTFDFAELLGELQEVDLAAPWDDGSGHRKVVGVPGMNAIAKYVAADLDVRTGVVAARVREAAGGWRVDTDQGPLTCARVVLATPAPQAMALLGAAHPLAQEIARVEMTPCLALMAAFESDAPVPFLSRRDPDDALEWIALNSSKPGRDGQTCWVAHAAPDWSVATLERTPDEIARLMLPMLCARLGADPASARHVAAHRWRYARVATALGAPFARDATGTLHAGGDWCLGARAECAWQSGVAIARDILGAP